MRTWLSFVAAALVFLGIASGAAVKGANAQSATQATLKITQLMKKALVKLHWYEVVPCPGNPGKDCYTHTPGKPGRWPEIQEELPVRFAFACPANSKVEKLFYRKGGRNITIARNLNTNSVVKTVNIRPWTADEFLNRCRERFGEPWPKSVPRGKGASLETTMKSGLNVYGKCSGQKQINKLKVLKVRTVCDTDFEPPHHEPMPY